MIKEKSKLTPSIRLSCFVALLMSDGKCTKIDAWNARKGRKGRTISSRLKRKKRRGIVESLGEIERRLRLPSPLALILFQAPDSSSSPIFLSSSKCNCANHCAVFTNSFVQDLDTLPLHNDHNSLPVTTSLFCFQFFF